MGPPFSKAGLDRLAASQALFARESQEVVNIQVFTWSFLTAPGHVGFDGAALRGSREKLGPKDQGPSLRAETPGV